LSVDRSTLAADTRDVAHVTVRALDAQGVLVPLADDQITFELSGSGKLIGVDNGNPSSHESYQGNTRALFHGMALALVQSTTDPGAVHIVARAKGLSDAALNIEVRKTL
jgi:beta-galactosidase